MKSKKTVVWLGVCLSLMLVLTGCRGVIAPVIGDTGSQTASNNESSNASGEVGAEGEVSGVGSGTEGAEGVEGDGAGSGSEGGGFGSGQEENEPRPEMMGNVVHNFETSAEISSSLGGMMQLNAVVSLYDEVNAEGNNALIAITLDDSEKYIACTWEIEKEDESEEADAQNSEAESSEAEAGSEENPDAQSAETAAEDEDVVYVLHIDEFTDYKTKVIDGVQTFVGIRYDFGMNGKGTIDVPMQ